ncbi:MAG: hypothetical protein ACOYM2_06100 [Rectinemataceae bacterium]
MRQIAIGCAILGAALASCSFGIVEDSTPLTYAQIATDLRELSGYVTLIPAAQAIGNRREFAESRTVQPSWSQVASKSPEQLYTDGRATAPNPLRVPSTGLIKNIYGNSDYQGYFTLTPVTGTSYYKVDFTLYPLDSMIVASTVESYYVLGSDSGWVACQDTTGAAGFVALSTNYVDGTVGDRTMLKSYSGSGYVTFPAPDLLGGSQIPKTSELATYYTTPITTEPAVQKGAAQWSSYTTETVTNSAGNLITSNQFYTETDAVKYSGVTCYTSNPQNPKTYTNITRFFGDRSAGMQTIRAFATASLPGNNKSTGQIDQVDISKTGGKTVYKSVIETWTGTGTATISGLSSSVVLSLTESAAGTGSFSGTQQTFTGTSRTGTTNNASIVKSATGTYTTTLTTNTTVATRVASKLSVSLDSLQDLALDLAGGIFHGSFSNGSFEGSYTDHSGASHAVYITGSGVVIDYDYSASNLVPGTFVEWADLP